MSVVELAVVTRQGGVYGLFGRADAERVATWLRNHGGQDIRVSVAGIESWGPIPHDGARRVEVRNPLGRAPSHAVWTLNDSLTGAPQWESRDPEGRLVSTASTAELRAATDDWLDAGYRIEQYRDAPSRLSTPTDPHSRTL